jgi:nitroimidazol reductase NimA-like FMN-containing flavoprotein (pyridoxamine 5'-phosphate oxidase superfamily)
MRAPVTTLDRRFSDADAVATSWEATRRVLEEAQLSWITTVRADGRPHVSPLVAVWLDDALYFATGPEEQKAVNLRTNPHVVLTTGCNGWEGGLDVMVEGIATRVTDAGRIQALVTAWTTKWDGRWRYEARGDVLGQGSGYALAFGVAPTKVLAFGKGSFSHTRHDFKSGGDERIRTAE